MPFELRNTPATFECLMEFILRDLAYRASLVYPVDVIAVGRTFQKKFDSLWNVFQRFRRAHLKLNPEICQLFQSEVRYMGHIVTRPREAEACT
jgi:hypothetical protein